MYTSPWQSSGGMLNMLGHERMHVAELDWGYGVWAGHEGSAEAKWELVQTLNSDIVIKLKQQRI